jgi:hypothetical protein
MMTNEFFCSTNGPGREDTRGHEGRAAGHNLSPQTSAKGELLGPQRFQCPVSKDSFFQRQEKDISRPAERAFTPERIAQVSRFPFKVSA